MTHFQSNKDIYNKMTVLLKGPHKITSGDGSRPGRLVWSGA
jgi:hypothetical protein